MRVLITGGAGFIGCNAAQQFTQVGWEVVVLDNLSRIGSDINLAWLRGHGACEFVRADIRDADQMAGVIGRGNFDAVLHLASQVAVTTSVVAPRLDFETNALGTFNVLEAIRLHSPRTILLNASTNKVYGKLQHVPVRQGGLGYEFADHPAGIAESCPLDFHSPYGCSKGAADQYVIDYTRIYGLRCVNFRQSCIYGFRQFGIEDQGWVAWFTIAHVLGKPFTIYGDGRQVRDVLFIDDLVAAFVRAIERIDSVAGQTFNMGGGPENALSLLKLIELLEQLSQRKASYAFSDWRPGDQRVYISDIGHARACLDWTPTISVERGVEMLYVWVMQNRQMFEEVLAKKRAG